MADCEAPLAPPAPTIDPEIAAHDGSHLRDTPSESTPLLPGSTTAAPSMSSLSPARVYTVLCLSSVVSFIAAFDGTIMSSSHPVITSYFNASYLAPWVSTSFLLASIAATPPISALVNPLGRRTMMLVSGILFTTATCLCGLAPTMMLFIAARALCGAAVSGLIITEGVIISDLVPIERRGTWQAILNLGFGSGSALGAASGGIMVDSLGWRWLFGIQVPLLALLTLSFCIIPAGLGRHDDDEEAKQTVGDAMRLFDYRGCLMAAAASTSLVFLLSLGGNVYPWSHPIIIAAAIVTVAAGYLFLRVESTAANPVYPLKLVTAAPFRSLYACYLLIGGAVVGLYFNIPIYFQAVLLDSPTASGLRLLVPTLSTMVSGIGCSLGVRYTGRTGPFLKMCPVVLGTAAAAACFYSPRWTEWAYLCSMAPIGIGAGLYYPAAALTCIAHTDKQRQPAIAGLMQLGRAFGAVFGVSVFGLVMQNALRSALEATVDGPDKRDIIERARRSVEGIKHLPQPYLDQVVAAYGIAVHVTFVSILVAVLCAAPILWSLRLKRIGAAAAAAAAK